MSTTTRTREEWLTERRESRRLGASETACLFRDPETGRSVGYTSEWAMWAQKSGLIPTQEPEDTEALYWGNKLERPIAEGLAEFAGVRIRMADPFTFVHHPTHGGLGATPDAYAYDDQRPDEGLAQIKNVGQYFARDWSDAPPLRVQVQCQTELAVTGLSWCIAAGLVGGNRLEWHVIERNDKFIAELERRVSEFWWRVAEGIAPPTDGSEQTKAAILLLHPADNGQTVSLGDEFADVAAQLAEAEATKKAAEAQIEELKNRVMAAVGDNTFASLPDGSGWSFKRQDRKAYSVEASTTRVLRRTKGQK